MIRLLTCLLLLLLAAPARGQAVIADIPGQLQQAYAETTASKWWSEHYRGHSNYGAAWRIEDTCYVGVCDGRSAQPGEVRGTDGYVAEYRSATGAWYKSPRWFGGGPTWEDAFHDALRRGFAPGPDVTFNTEEARFLKAITTRRSP